MFVYRYEDKNSTGPYRSKEPGNMYEYDKYIHEDDDHPTSYQDGLDISSNHICACSSLVKLKKWFFGYNQKLKNSIFSIYKYKIDKKHVSYGKSKNQVIFCKNKFINKIKVE